MKAFASIHVKKKLKHFFTNNISSSCSNNIFRGENRDTDNQRKKLILGHLYFQCRLGHSNVRTTELTKVICPVFVDVLLLSLPIFFQPIELLGQVLIFQGILALWSFIGLWIIFLQIFV